MLVYVQGDPGNTVWLVADGQVTLRLAPAPVNNYRRGDEVMMPRVQSREVVNNDRRHSAIEDSVLYQVRLRWRSGNRLDTHVCGHATIDVCCGRVPV